MKMQTTLILREATTDDLPQLLKFEQDLINTERPFDPTLGGNICYYNLPEMIAAAHVDFIVAEIESNVIGCGYSRIQKAKPYLKHQEYAYLGFMYVQPSHRGKGINQMIIEKLRELAKKRGMTELRLEVYAGNLSAIKAYEKAGFQNHMIEMRLSNED